MPRTIEELQQATLAYYPLKGDAGDYTSNGRNGTANEAVRYVPGVFGSAADFRASGASVLLPFNDFDRWAADFTLSAWVNLAECAPVVGEVGDLGCIAGRLGVSYPSGRLQFFFYFDGPTAADNRLVVLTSENPLPVGTWTNVLVSYDHGRRELSFYFNGILDSVASVATKVGPQDRPHLPVAFAIGGNHPQFASHNTFNGSISDVAVMGAALDAADVGFLSGAVPLAEGTASPPDQAAPRGREAEAQAFPLLPLLLVAAFVTVTNVAFQQALVKEIETQPTAPPPPRDLTPQQIADRITAIVGRPAEPGKRAERGDLGIPPFQRVHVDIGGLGRYRYVTGTVSGFADAINVTVNSDSTVEKEPVPNLVLVRPWPTTPMYPLGDAFADYVTLQSAPLYSAYVAEIARILRPGGSVGLWIDQEAFRSQIDDLARLLHCTPIPCTAAAGNLERDEFLGKYALPKLLLTKNR